jgi:hypothetical protein
MAIQIFAATSTIGGIAGSLDNIDHSIIAAGDIAIVLDPTNEIVHEYYYDATGADAESNPTIIRPNSNSGNGRWYLLKKYRGEQVTNTDGNPTADSTVLAVDSTVAESTWESVGPTSPGTADNIWAALNAAPTDVDWIKVKAVMRGADGASSTTVSLKLYARSGASSESAADENLIQEISVLTDGSGNGDASNVTQAVIPVSSLEFDLYWAGTMTTESIDLYLVGWGYNDY